MHPRSLRIPTVPQGVMRSSRKSNLSTCQVTQVMTYDNLPLSLLRLSKAVHMGDSDGISLLGLFERTFSLLK